MKSKLGECCPALNLVLERPREGDRLGVMVETMFSLSDKKPPREVVVVRMRKNKDRKAQYANSTFVECNYCPFCGASLAQPEPKKKRTKEPAHAEE
jgi:hypothetical protein